MKPQSSGGPYRGGENKKEKPTKADKLYNALKRAERRAAARVVKKKETAA